jgi:hypothetical protein
VALVLLQDHHVIITDCGILKIMIGMAFYGIMFIPCSVKIGEEIK